MRILTLVLFFFIALSSGALAETYYVSSSTGDDFHDGISEAKPFKTMAAVSGKDFLKCGDRVYLKRGDVWEGAEADASNIDSSCEDSKNPITLGAYGEGVRPILYGNTVYSGKWTAESPDVYCAENVDWDVRTVSVDDESVLWRAKSSGETGPGNFYYEADKKRVCVRLADGSGPAQHRLRLGRYPENVYTGLVAPRADGHGDNFEIRDITVRTSNAVGFFITGKNTRCINVKAEFCAHDGWFAAMNAAADMNAEGSSCDLCTVRYSNAMGRGHGQAMTVYAPYCRVTRSLIERNGMAGVDFLDYHAVNSDAHHGVLRDSVVRTNGQWPGAENWDPGVYVDGARDILIYNNLIEGQGRPRGQRPVPGIKVSNEHPGLKDVGNIYVVRNVSRDNLGQGMVWWTGNEDRIEGAFEVENSFQKGEYADTDILYADLATGVETDFEKLPEWVKEEIATGSFDATALEEKLKALNPEDF